MSVALPVGILEQDALIPYLNDQYQNSVSDFVMKRKTKIESKRGTLSSLFNVVLLNPSSMTL